MTTDDTLETLAAAVITAAAATRAMKCMATSPEGIKLRYAETAARRALRAHYSALESWEAKEAAQERLAELDLMP